MTRKASKAFLLVGAVIPLLLGGAAPLLAAGEDMYDYTKIPPFIEVGLNPNLLMLIDNSASMYDQAYVPANNSYCFAGVDGANSYAPYDGTVPYSGYFAQGSDSWYVYDSTDEQFEARTATAAATVCSTATGDKYTATDLCITVDGSNVTAFAAKGRFMNWLAASKFDVEKKILTGGKYDDTHDQLVLETRGCLENRFMRKVAVAKGGSPFFASFGVRPPSGYERDTFDLPYNGSISNTRIEIFTPTATGFSFDPCRLAINAWSEPDLVLGDLKTLTTNCLAASGTSNFTASTIAFNHILQECWYYKSNGAFQSGAGTVTSLKSDCQQVYGINNPPASAPLPADYETPVHLAASDVCNGHYTPDEAYLPPDPAHPWGSGYMGQCWEEKYEAEMVPAECPVGAPTTMATAQQDVNNFWYFCDGAGLYQRCSKNNRNSCKAADYAVWYVPDESGGTAYPDSVDWTDDNADGGYACMDYALKKYCTDMDEVTVVDSTEINDPQGTAWGIPSVMVDNAALAQLGQPLKVLKGRVAESSQPTGLIHEFKFNLRMGAMQFNTGADSGPGSNECKPVQRPDGTWKASLYDCLVDKGVGIHQLSVPETGLDNRNGGRIVSYVDEGEGHVDQLVAAINNITANAWTPLAEAYFEAVGYYTQNQNLRLNGEDYVCDSDHSTAPATYPLWVANHPYAANDRVRFAWDYDNNGVTDETKVYYTHAGGTSTPAAATIADDKGVIWAPFDPVLAGCQSNNVLIISDGGSTADLHPTMTDFARAAGHNDGDTAATYAAGILETANYECKTVGGLSNLYGTTLLDDLSFYANKNGSNIFVYPTVDDLDKKKITTYVVAAGTLQDNGTTYDCNPKVQLQQVALNSGTALLESTNPAMLEVNLRKVFAAVGGEPASGSAASVISNSRSGEGAIFQAIFFPHQEDQLGNEITWAGDVHALWLDERGNIREDCGTDPDVCGVGDSVLDKHFDRILRFYSDPISNAARAHAFRDSNGDGYCDDLTDLDDDGLTDDPDKNCDPANKVEGAISLRNINYLWSAGEWLAEVTETNTEIQRVYADYAAAQKQRYIITSLNTGVILSPTMIPFTAWAVNNALGDTAYKGYLRANSTDEANDIIGYIRGDDIKVQEDNVTPRGYRSRQIDWDGNTTLEVWKLGDIVNSTPTVVSVPAEDYDLIYGDKSYQAFRQRYRNRRAVVYAGGNDGGLHAFNAGYYDRAAKRIDKAPPADVINGIVQPSKTQYDLGAELWMFVPKNVIPHLKWLTGRASGEDPALAPAEYSHVNYVDLKPYIFDAKIFAPSDTHPHGWGTVLVGGMGMGGGNIGVDTNPLVAGDELTMRASYFVLDITNPEVPPRILMEFTRQDLGYGIGAPTAIPMLLCDLKVNCPANTTVATTWPMDWYLAFPSGPHDAALPLAALNGKSDQAAKIFTLPLGGTNAALNAASSPLGRSGTFARATTTHTVPLVDADFNNSFFSDVIAIDYDLDFKTDTLYFGSVANADEVLTDNNTGGMHRLVTGENSTPALWTLNTFFKTPGHQPVSGSPSVASDGQRAWVYFGTGRYYSAQLDKDNISQQSYYGIKENYTAAGVRNLYAPSDANLVDVSKVWVEEATGALHLPSGVSFLTATDYAGPDNLGDVTTLAATTFKALDLEMSQKDVSNLDKYNGWKLDFGWYYDPSVNPPPGDGWYNVTGERNLGQAAILGNIVTFTTFLPSENLCTPEGESFLWAPYYRTGTAYSKSVIGTRDRADDTVEVLRKVSVGAGLASTPNIHSGAELGSTAFVQTSTGAIVSVEQNNPGVVKSSMISWRELGD